MSNLKPPSEFPYEIRTEAEAAALGVAMHEVMHFEIDWVSRVFTGDTKLCYQTGPEVIRNEMRDMWKYSMSLDERRQIMAVFLRERLE